MIDQTYGTWINSDYNYSGQNAKIIITPEGIVEEYNMVTTKDLIYRSKRSITESWYDGVRNITLGDTQHWIMHWHMDIQKSQSYLEKQLQ
jgi:hypothetical protein